MAQPHPLDNPVWESLTTRQQALALGDDRLRRYAANVAPFAAAPEAGARLDNELHALIASGESIYFVGLAPRWPKDFSVIDESCVVQMLSTRRVQMPLEPSSWRALKNADRPAMLDLTAMVFPGFFRERTNTMGRYLGISLGGRLAAMAGERMASTDYVEVSAVCTHPKFVGRGYAAALVALLVNEIYDRGLTPYLHVGENNSRAIRLYERLGFVERARLDLWQVERA
jgi:ribosomal protein S18 acetylase RimI-like enzyme